jgi:hypothetical protein
MADEVPPEGVAVAGVLRLQVLGPVLPHHLDPGLGQHGEVIGLDVFRRGDDGDVRPDVGPDSLVPLANLVR